MWARLRELSWCHQTRCAGDDEGTFCQAPAKKCVADSACKTCLAPRDLGADGRPTTAERIRLLPWFLRAAPTACCAKGGLGAYNQDLARIHGSAGGADAPVDGLDGARVTSAFRAASVALGSQASFTAALAASRRLADEAAAKLVAAYHGAALL